MFQKWISLIIILLSLSFYSTDVYSYCLVKNAHDGQFFSLRDKVERNYNHNGSLATCNTQRNLTSDYNTGIHQAILFATPELCDPGYSCWMDEQGNPLPGIREINLLSPLVFQNTQHNLAIGQPSQGLINVLEEKAYPYSSSYNFSKNNLGLVVVDAQSIPGNHQPFECTLNTSEVILRNLIILTAHVSKQAVFDASPCLRDGGSVYVCEYGFHSDVEPGTPGWCDGDLTTNPHHDLDGDGYCEEAPCDNDIPGGDCDDSNAQINPGQNEICDNQIDDNCNGQVDLDDSFCRQFTDDDGDGYCESTSCEDGSQPNDCDDSNNAIYPSHTEICNNQVDDDCDGQVDTHDSDCDGFDDPHTDNDGDGYCELEPCSDRTLPGDCDDTNKLIFPTATEQCSNRIDDDCDGKTDRADEDCQLYVSCQPGSVRSCGSDVGSCSSGTQTCNALGRWGTCEGSVGPTAEICHDNLDNDCNGLIDAQDQACASIVCTQGESRTCGSSDVGACAYGVQSCTAEGQWSTCEGAIEPATEICDNQIDDDCDGLTDQEDECLPVNNLHEDNDGDGYCEEAVCVDGSIPGDCNDNQYTVNPGAIEICDQLDNDCDGEIDEDCAKPGNVDNDGDGYCEEDCVDGTREGDCNDQNASINPGAVEICDGLDNNCNKEVDESCLDPLGVDNDHDGFCEGLPGLSGIDICLDGSQPGDCHDADRFIYPGAFELCDLKDNDCDMIVDENCSPVGNVDNDHDGYCEENCIDGTEPGDCNDLLDFVHPYAIEYCDLRDNDCDGSVDEECIEPLFNTDKDGDGYCEENCKDGSLPGDCNDQNAFINPLANDIPRNSIDENCDGIDGDLKVLVQPQQSQVVPGTLVGFLVQLEFKGGYQSVAQLALPAGFQEKMHFNFSPEKVTSSSPVSILSIQVPLSALAGDYPLLISATTQDLMATSNATLSVLSSACQPHEIPEVSCLDGLDNDCDGLSDAVDPDCYLSTDDDQDGYCEAQCDDGSQPGDCNDNDPTTYPGAEEICSDGQDNDCNGIIDDCNPNHFKDDDGDGYCESEITCADGSLPGDCDDTNAKAYPGNSEQTDSTCNDSVDNDCNGEVDDILNYFCPQVDVPPVDAGNNLAGGVGCQLNNNQSRLNLIWIFLLVPFVTLYNWRMRRKTHLP